MSLAGIGSVLSGASNILGNVLGYSANTQANNINAQIAQNNLLYQYQNLDYQRALQNVIFEREDNAISRRAKDLENAGLSKTLAAGSGANAGTVVSTSAPVNNYQHKAFTPNLNFGGSLLDLADYINRADRNKAEIDLLKEQTIGQSEENITKRVVRNNLYVEAKKKDLEAELIRANQIGKNLENSKAQQTIIADVEKKYKEVKLLEEQINNQMLHNTLTGNQVEDEAYNHEMGTDRNGNSIINAALGHGSYTPIGWLIRGYSALGSLINRGLWNRRNKKKNVDN